MDNDYEVGMRIRRLRSRHFWSIEKLAKVLDIQPRDVSRIENGGKASDEVLLKISIVFATTIEYLKEGRLVEVPMAPHYRHVLTCIRKIANNKKRT